MKKILYLHAGAELYGADIVLLELLKNLDKTKFIPYVILPCDGPLVEKLRQNNIWVKVIQYPILRRKYFNPIGLLTYIKDYITFSSKITKIAKSKEIDIIHTNTAAVLEGIYIKRKLKRPLIWHIHEIIVRPKLIHKFLSFLIAKNADEVITVSEAVKMHLKSTGYFKNEIKVIYNGVDNKMFNKDNETDYIRKEFNIPENAIIVGMIGRVNAWKGQNDFLDAMDIVLENNKNVYAMLVGGVFDGEEWRITELKEKIQSMKHKEKVIFDDYRKDSKNIHALYDIFVLPSTNPDPLPTVVLEAMASSTPVLGYRHGGICEMVKEDYNGLLAEPCNFKDLAFKIEKIIGDNNLIEQFGYNSLKRQKDKFSKENYVKNFQLLYSQTNNSNI
ncbi:glycosyltransferase family 4 protein [Clostridium pasteurianum]|uniref:Glycosyltransferase n=1 Tax=Clostridium pasteurianum BC1 TaxID=86416 RepID=R4JYH5_CLOPA|nr:glycosyltransferase family 4 protein [Clostridium pasteurianum]AGK95882.1 glycosyltransferase [Clostridium pasteurianum BC1]